jgi:hypothetical protein
MGRELKRVPRTFDWPLSKLWKGYVMPAHLVPRACPDCDHSGYNPATKQIADAFYGHGTGRRWVNDITQDEVDALVANNRLSDFTHTWTPGAGWQRDPAKPHPTAAQVNAWSRQGFGHDAINRWILIETRARRLGVWGHCETCSGEGELFANAQHKADYDAWERTDPPTGDGYQLWDTTSEGKPLSPVFATLDELAAWCAGNATTFADNRATAAQWRDMLAGDRVHHQQGRHIFI